MKQPPLKPSAVVAGLAACCAALLLAPAVASVEPGAADPAHRRAAAHAGPSVILAQASPGAEPVVARLSLRINELEAEVRRLTGQNEELAHRLRQLRDRLETVTSDQELRLRALEERGAAPAGNADADSAAAPEPAPSPPVAAVPGADKGARVLGTVRQRSGSGEAAPPEDETPEQLYDRAYALLATERDYGAAERVLRSFIEANPDHALAPNAHYWLGRTYFVREDFENAAFAFAEGFQKFPKADKAPANLLNLGMALARLGKTREACTTYARLLRTYESAGDSLKRRVAREREQAKCGQR